MLSPEPILDVVRGLSTVASFGIVINQMWSLMDEIFTSDCDYCRGTGRIICRHCHGTKTLRRRPGEFHYQHMAVVDRSPRDLYPCVYCGPNTRYDFQRVEEDNEDEAYNIMDNLKAAVANKRRPFPSPILAGTIPCPECGGNPLIRRHTPNWARLTQTEEPFDIRAGLRMAAVSRSGQRSRIRPRKYLEYPSQMPRNEEADPAKLAKLLGEKSARLVKKKKKKGGSSMRASDQLTADDYITPYIDDEDTDVEE
ncbi:g10225 [Coccomyxa viridis]|uniref:G10225 protein n=1 Tax=Coccomyxa viridis TaxID=1274662 RepID=A0ABP1G7E4_9CHLO